MVFRLLHRPKYQRFPTESNIMVKVVTYLPKSEAVVRRCSQLFTEKRFFISIFFSKVAGLQPEKRHRQRSFPVSLPNNSEHIFCETRFDGDCFC